MSIESSVNFKNGRFINLEGNRPMIKGSAVDIWKEFLFGKQQRVPMEPLEVIKIDPDLLVSTVSDELKVTWLGHSSAIIEIEGNIILTDPVFSKRTSPVTFVGPKRYHRSLPLEPENYPEIDLVIISHDHYDHLDYRTIRKIHGRVKRFTVPLGVGFYLIKWGVDPNKITELDWWEHTTLSGGLKIVATPAQHYSGRGLFDRYETQWASWAVIGKNYRVFFSGDSGYNRAFKEIGWEYGPFDITLMENGQYNLNWDHVHMLPEQSLRAHLDVRGKIMLPVHWATYNLSVHNWTEPVERLFRAARNCNVTISTPRVGETLIYGKYIPALKWWPRIGNNVSPVSESNNEPCMVTLNEKRSAADVCNIIT